MSTRPSQAPPLRIRAGAALAALLLLAAGVLVSPVPRPTVQSVLVGPWPSTLVLASGHAVVANEGDGTLSLVDLAQARLVRTLPLAHTTPLSPVFLALAPRTHRLVVVVRHNDGSPSVAYLLDSHSNTVVRTVRVGNLASAVAVDEHAGQVLVTNEGDGTLSVLDARSGALLRTRRVGPYPVALAVDARRTHAFVVEARPRPQHNPIPAFVQGNGVVRLLDTRRGVVLRTVGVGRAPTTLVLAPRTDRAFVANRHDGTVSVLDARSGRVLRTVRVAMTPCALAVDGRLGRVFVLDAGDGTLTMLDARTGQVRQTLLLERHPRTDLAAGLPCALAVDATRGRVYATTAGPRDRVGLPLGRGLLHVIDARRGVQVQTIAVGLNPQALAVEAGSGHIVVANGGGMLGQDVRWVDQLRQLPWLVRLLPRPAAPPPLRGSLSLVRPPT